MSNLAVIDGQSNEVVSFDNEQLNLIKRTLMRPKDREATDDELKLFAAQCQRTGLDPFTRQIYAIYRKDKRQGGAEVMQVQTSIDGFRLIAERTGKYAGQLGPLWCGPDGEWKDVWLSDKPPAAAKVAVLKHSFTEPLWAVAKWSEFVQTDFNGNVTPMWKNLGTVMIAKVAESQALRKAFPNDLSGLYCVDLTTEILTQRGWQTVDNLREDDLTLTLNTVTGQSEWQPITAVHVFPKGPKRMQSIEGANPKFSVLATLDHRWAVRQLSYGKGIRKTEPRDAFKIVRGHELNTNHRIPLCAEPADTPEEQKWSDAFVEIVAWVWTEGTLTSDNLIRIAQSHKNDANCDRIDAALSKLFGPEGGRMEARKTKFPAWSRVWAGEYGRSSWHLNKQATEIILEGCPDKVPHYEWLLSLTRSQLSLFIDVSMRADNAGLQTLAQKDNQRSDAFAFACILDGRAVRYSERHTAERPGYSALTMHQVKYMDAREVRPFAAASRTDGPVGNNRCRIEEIDYDGEVWCPVTPNGTWLARRNGSVYFTGNTSEEMSQATTPVATEQSASTPAPVHQIPETARRASPQAKKVDQTDPGTGEIVADSERQMYIDEVKSGIAALDQDERKLLKIWWEKAGLPNVDKLFPSQANQVLDHLSELDAKLYETEPAALEVPAESDD